MYKDLDNLLELCCSVCTLTSGYKPDNKVPFKLKKRDFKQIPALKFTLFHYGKKTRIIHRKGDDFIQTDSTPISQHL